MAEYLLYSQEPLEEGELYGTTRPWRNDEEEGEWATTAMKGVYFSPRPEDDTRSRVDKIVDHHNQMLATNQFDPPCPSSTGFDDYTGAPLDPHLNKSLFGDEDGETEGKGLYSFNPMRVIKGDMLSRFNRDEKLIAHPKKGQAFYLEADYPVYIRTLFTTNLGYVHVLPDWTKIYMKVTRRNFDVAAITMSCIDIWRPSFKEAYELAATAECTSWLLSTPSVQRIAGLSKNLVVSTASIGEVAVVTFSRPLSKIKDQHIFQKINSGNAFKASGAQPILDGSSYQNRALASIATSCTGCATFVSGGNYSNSTAEACAASIRDEQVKGKYYKIFLPDLLLNLKHKRIEFLELFPKELLDHTEEFIDIKCHSFFLLKLKKPVKEYAIRSLRLDKKTTVQCVSEQEYYSSKKDSACLTKHSCNKKKRVNTSMCLQVPTNDVQGFMQKFNAIIAKDDLLSPHFDKYIDGKINILFSSRCYRSTCRDVINDITKLVQAYGGNIRQINDTSDFTKQEQNLSDGIKLYDSVSEMPHTCNRAVTHCRYLAVCDEDCIRRDDVCDSSGSTSDVWFDSIAPTGYIHGDENKDILEDYATRMGKHHTLQKKPWVYMTTERSLSLPGAETSSVRLLKERELITKHASGDDRYMTCLEKDSVPDDRYGYIPPCLSATIASEENYGRNEERIKLAQTAGVQAMLSSHIHEGSVWVDNTSETGAGGVTPTGNLTVEKMLSKMFV